MWRVLLERIPHCVCEPFAVGALLGGVYFLYLHWRKSRVETLLIGALLTFLVGWRVARPIQADRYAFALVPVAVFFTVWGIRLVAGWGRRWFPRIPWTFLWFTGMLITVICISFLHHEEDRAFFTLFRALRREIRGMDTPVVLVANRDFSFFLDRRIRMFLCEWPNVQKQLPLPDASVRYVLFRLPRKMPPIPEKLRRELQPVAEVSGRGRRKFSYHLWKWTPDPMRCLRGIAESEVDRYAAPETGNLAANAGFESVRPPKETAALVKRYVSVNADFYRKPGLLLPADWRPCIVKPWGGARSPEFELDDARPIRGKYSLRVKIDPRMSREIEMSKRLPAGDYIYSMLVRAEKGARFRLFFHVYRKGQHRENCNVAFCTIPEDGTYHVSVPVFREELVGGDWYMAAIGGLEGELFFDEVSLVPDLRPRKR